MAAQLDTPHADASDAVKQFIQAGNFKTGEVMQPMRILISGAAGGADLMGMIQLFGGKETSQRIVAAIRQLQIV
jgi:hypothetical protein